MTAPRNLAWHPRLALLGALATLPAGFIVAFDDLARGLAFAIGVLPATLVGVLPTRRQRNRVVVMGALFGLSIFVGSLLSQTDALAVIGMLVLPVVVALAAARARAGGVAMTLGLPLIAVGLSFSSTSEAAGIGLLILAGSVVSYALSCITWIWPEVVVPPRPPAPLLPRGLALEYGLRLGLTAGVATLLGVIAGTDHVGWAPAAALFVIRPVRDMQRLRSIGRVVSVTVGALAAVALVHANPADWVVAVAAVVAVGLAGGTHGSRWYVTPAFSTFLVILMLLAPDDSDAAEHWRFWERVGWTAVGVALAYLFGLLVPRILKRRNIPAAVDAGPG